MIKTILVILALAILASASTVNAGECSKGYRAGRRQVKRMWRNRGSRCANIDGFDVAVRRMTRNRYRTRMSDTGDKKSYNRCARRGANDTLEKYQQECDHANEKTRESDVTCDEYWLEICCDGVCVEEETDYTSGDEVRAANVCRTECFDEHDGRLQCNWHWRAEGCRRGGGSKRGRIQCIRPRRSRVREEGHEEVCEDLDPNVVPYECETGDKICCTESSRTTVTFEDKVNWGLCIKKEERSDRKDERGGRENRRDGRSSIECTRPRQGKVFRDGHEAVCATLDDKGVPYKCRDGSKICCTESSITVVTFEEKDWGECRKIQEEEL